MFIKLDFFFGKYISLVFGLQNFVIDLIWYCARILFIYLAYAKKISQYVLVEILKFRFGS